MKTATAMRVSEFPHDYTSAQVSAAIRVLHHSRNTRQHREAVARLMTVRQEFTLASCLADVPWK